MNESKRQSYSLTLRANPSDRNKMELINYLKSFDRGLATKKVEDILMAALLSLAKEYSGKYNQEQLRKSCLENCNALLHHSSYLRQVLNVGEGSDLEIKSSIRAVEGTPDLNESVSSNGVGLRDGNKGQSNGGSPKNNTVEVEEAEIEEIPSSIVEDGNVSDVNAMFGN